MHDKIKILDIDEKQETFVVRFEVPGHHYNQNYPKRLAHSFPLREHLLEKKGNGDYVFEKTLEKNYLKDKEQEKEKSKVSSKLDKVKGDVRGKEKKF